jgi:hypothetical protein
MHYTSTVKVKETCGKIPYSGRNYYIGYLIVVDNTKDILGTIALV